MHDREARFDAFYNARSAQLVRSLYLACGDLTRAEDCAQEAFLRAWRRWSKLEGDDPVGWVRTVAWRLCVSDWRSTQRLQGALARLKLVDATTPDTAAGSPLTNALGLLDALPIDQRRVAVLYYIEDLPVDDIAALLAVPPGTVKSRLSRGREALRRSLAADQG